MIDISELRSMVNATQFESFANSVINSLLDRLEEDEKNVALLERLIDARGSSLNAVANECDALRLRIEAAESECLEQARLNGMGSEREASLMAKLEAAEKENAKLRIALAEKVTSEATLRDLNVGNGFINATFEEGSVQPMLDALADQFVESGSSNYIEMQLHSKAAISLLLTLQRVDGKTPHQLREEAEKERDVLRADLAAAEKENIKLREALAEKVTSETVLRDLSIGNGSINASFEGGAVHLFVDSLANQFVESGAANYLEMRFHSEATGPLLLTLQRVNGKTPHQLRTEAEKERDILRAKVAAEI